MKKKISLKNKNILIFGLGKSGDAVRKFFQKRGITPFLFDDRQNINDLESFDIKKLDLVVVSPGIDENHELYKVLEDNKIKIVSELELGFQNIKGDIIGITGTNGKTTTALLIYHILKNSYKSTFIGGNIGIPLISICGETSKKSRIICEVSSFQLIKSYIFKPKISAVLNLSPDHLNRHKTFEKYVEAKCKILKNQTKLEYCVLNYDDKRIRELNDKTKAKVLYFSTSDQLNNKNFYGVFHNDKRIYYKTKKDLKLVMDTGKIKLLGQKNLENIMCAITISILCKVSVEQIKELVNNFCPLPHRLETVLIQDRVTYINDSKATNIASTLADIKAFNTNIILLLGGSDKGEDFKSLFKELKSENCQSIIFGETKENMERCANEVKYYNYLVEENFEGAVKVGDMLAKEFSKNGDHCVLLLAPACASFDEFKNYEERGEYFKEIINKLNKK